MNTKFIALLFCVLSFAPVASRAANCGDSMAYAHAANNWEMSDYLSARSGQADGVRFVKHTRSALKRSRYIRKMALELSTQYRDQQRWLKLDSEIQEFLAQTKSLKRASPKLVDQADGLLVEVDASLMGQVSYMAQVYPAFRKCIGL